MNSEGEQIQLWHAEQRLTALTHVYLELQLPLGMALEAAIADVAHLDGCDRVAEAA